MGKKISNKDVKKYIKNLHDADLAGFTLVVPFNKKVIKKAKKNAPTKLKVNISLPKAKSKKWDGGTLYNLESNHYKFDLKKMTKVLHLGKEYIDAKKISIKFIDADGSSIDKLTNGKDTIDYVLIRSIVYLLSSMIKKPKDVITLKEVIAHMLGDDDKKKKKKEKSSKIGGFNTKIKGVPGPSKDDESKDKKKSKKKKKDKEDSKDKKKSKKKNCDLCVGKCNGSCKVVKKKSLGKLKDSNKKKDKKKESSKKKDKSSNKMTDRKKIEKAWDKIDRDDIKAI